MLRKSVILSGVAVVAVVSFVTLAPAFGQFKNQPKAKAVTLTGKVIDLHCFMTEKWVSADHAKCTADCIRAGVPAALQTEDGIYVLGAFNRNVSEALLPFAFKMAEVSGNVYEKHNVRYLDFNIIKESQATSKMNRPSMEEEEEEEEYDEDLDG